MKTILALACMIASIFGAYPAFAALNIFACVPEWASLASELGGDKVSVYQASNALQDPHRIEARPSLVAKMRNADLAICTGADLEAGWLPVLVQSSGNRKVQPGQPGYLAAAELVDRLEVPARLDRADGDIHAAGNPHVHLDPRNIARIAGALTQRLQQLDSGNAVYFEARGRNFQERWSVAMERWEKDAARLRGMKIVSHHKSASYLLHWLGMVEVMNVEPKPGVPPSAGHLAELVARQKTEPADAIVRAAYNDPKPTRWLAERTGLALVEIPYTVGGTPEVKDLFSLFDETLARFAKARK